MLTNFLPAIPLLVMAFILALGFAHEFTDSGE